MHDYENPDDWHMVGLQFIIGGVSNGHTESSEGYFTGYDLAFSSRKMSKKYIFQKF